MAEILFQNVIYRESNKAEEMPFLAYEPSKLTLDG